VSFFGRLTYSRSVNATEWWPSCALTHSESLPALQVKRRERVAEVVQSVVAQLGGGEQRLPHATADVVVVEETAGRVGEHQRVARGVRLVGLERRLGRRGERHAAPEALGAPDISTWRLLPFFGADSTPLV
jgi:hypothetical protein